MKSLCLDSNTHTIYDEQGKAVSITASKDLFDNGQAFAENISMRRLIECEWDFVALDKYYDDIDNRTTSEAVLAKAISKKDITEPPIECPECGSDDLDIKKYNDGRCDRVRVSCCNCDWEVEDII